MADQQTAAYQHQRDEAKLQKARNDFILAMQQLAEERIPNNPHWALVELAFPAWRDAGPRRKDNSDPRRFRYRPEQQHADERVKVELRKQILKAWAHYFWLVDKDRQPLDWIVEYAEKFCQRESGEWRDGPTPLGRLSSASGQYIVPAPFFPELRIPMADPSPRDGEAFSEFRKRARAAFFTHLRSLKRRYSQAVRPAKQENATADPHDHFKWLLLSQCCGMKLSDIRLKYPYVHSEAAISLGVKRAAGLLGIARRSELRKSLSKTSQSA